jgi:hypothetical protein
MYGSRNLESRDYLFGIIFRCDCGCMYRHFDCQDEESTGSVVQKAAEASGRRSEKSAL